MDCFLGDIQLYPFNFAPIQFMECRGQTLTISGNQALYSLFGITYGGDGTTNFCIPNLIGTEPVPGMQYYICTEGLYPCRP